MHPKHSTPLQNKTRNESLGSLIWSFEALIGEPRYFYWTVLDPYTYFLSSWRLLLLDPWTFASALELLCSSLGSGPEKDCFGAFVCLKHSNTWDSKHWVEFQSLFGHFVQKMYFLWWWLLLLWLFNKGLLTYWVDVVLNISKWIHEEY